MGTTLRYSVKEERERELRLLRDRVGFKNIPSTTFEAEGTIVIGSNF